MDHIQPRIHEEINDYEERIYSFTFRQWICLILIAIITIPSYFFLKNIIGEEATSYIIILEVIPFAIIGWIPIQGLKAEKIIPFWYRNYFKFAKPLIYKTEKELQEEMVKKKQERKERLGKLKHVSALATRKKRKEEKDQQHEEIKR